MEVTLQRVIDGYHQCDVDAIMSVRSLNCSHQFLPHSMNARTLTNAEYAQYIGRLIPLFKDFQLQVHSQMVDPEARSMCFWATGTATSELGDYRNEYVYSMRTTDDGKHIDAVQEFSDSATAMIYFQRLGALWRAQSKL